MRVFQEGYEYQKFAVRRLLARYLDYLLVMVIVVKLMPFSGSPAMIVLGYVVYHFVVILAGGKSFGRFVLQIDIQYDGPKSRMLSLIERELLLWIFFPFVALSYLFPYSPCLHDRWTDTEVIQG